MFDQIIQAIRNELVQQQFPDSWISEVLTNLEFGNLVDGWSGEARRKYRIAAMFSPALARFLSNAANSPASPQPIDVEVISTGWTVPLDQPASRPALPWQ